MKHDTIKYEIIKYLDTQKYFVFGGAVGRAIHDLTGAKESIVERRCRELVKEGRLERELRQVGGFGPKCVCYKIKLPTNEKGLRAYYKDTGKLKVEIVEVNGQRVARETIV